MTTIRKTIFTCHCCGNTFEDEIIGSTNEFGYMDLDTRPAQMRRSTMPLWIHQCPECGYVLQDDQSVAEKLKDYIESDEYQNCEDLKLNSDVAIKFYRNGLILIKTDEKRHACLSFLNAAWDCDDRNAKEEADACRRRFLKCFDTLEEYEKIPDMELIRIDVLRRADEFERVLNEYENYHFENDFLEKIADFEKKKCQEKDNACYTVEDVEND